MIFLPGAAPDVKTRDRVLVDPTIERDDSITSHRAAVRIQVRSEARRASYKSRGVIVSCDLSLMRRSAGNKFSPVYYGSEDMTKRDCISC